MVKLSSDFASTNDTPYRSLTGELYGVFREIFNEKFPWYIESTLYFELKFYKPHHWFTTIPFMESAIDFTTLLALL